MNIFVPVGFILVFMALYIFREYNRVKRAKHDERRENLRSVRQEYLDRLIKPRDKGADPDTPTEGPDNN